MKKLALTFEDSEFKELKAEKLKTNLTWVAFILDRCLK